MLASAPLAVATRIPDRPAAEIRVNFGLFAGRQATPAELETLGQALLGIVDDLTVVGEQWFFVSPSSEASVHQVRIDVPAGAMPDDEVEAERLVGRLLQESEHWARACIAERSLEAGDPGLP